MMFKTTFVVAMLSIAAMSVDGAILKRNDSQYLKQLAQSNDEMGSMSTVNGDGDDADEVGPIVNPNSQQG